MQNAICRAVCPIFFLKLMLFRAILIISIQGCDHFTNLVAGRCVYTLLLFGFVTFQPSRKVLFSKFQSLFPDKFRASDRRFFKGYVHDQMNKTKIENEEKISQATENIINKIEIEELKTEAPAPGTAAILKGLLGPLNFDPAGPGINGNGVTIDKAKEAEVREKFKENQFNVMASDMVSVSFFETRRFDVKIIFFCRSTEHCRIIALISKRLKRRRHYIISNYK